MMPPLLRHCPDCGFVGLGPRFSRDESGSVECPACGIRFDPIDRPWLQ